MSDMVSEILEVLAKWNEVVDYEKHDWDGNELNLFVRIKKTHKVKPKNGDTE